jgi:hypothetical protein
MKIILSKAQWQEIGEQTGWIKSTAKKNKKSPKEHGFIDQCVKENKDKKDPGAYCASIVDKVKGTTKWREESKKDK